MTKILITLIFFAVLFSGGYYYFVLRDESFSEKLSISNFVSKLNFLEKLEISKKSEQINETAQDIKIKTEDIFAGLSKSFSATVGKVSSTVSLFDEVRNSKAVQIISVLDKKSDSNSSGANQEEVGVCVNFSLNQQIAYLIENPFQSLVSTSTYIIDWGDGGIDRSVFTTGTAQVSHAYVGQGEFVTKFRVESGEVFAEVLRRVCIK